MPMLKLSDKLAIHTDHILWIRAEGSEWTYRTKDMKYWDPDKTAEMYSCTLDSLIWREKVREDYP